MIKCKSCWQVPVHSNFASIALLIMRLITGIAFIYHGWGKIQNPFGWMPGSPVPGFLQFLAALAEFGGGIALILGVVTCLASVGLALTMVVAVYFHAVIMGDPFVNMTGGSSYEPAMGYLGISLIFLAMGPGRYSVDRFLFGERNKV